MNAINSLLSRRALLRGSLAAGSLAFFAPGVFAEQLARTPRLTEGPFYPDKLPLDTDNDLLIVNDSITPAVGEVTHLSGRILDANSAVHIPAARAWGETERILSEHAPNRVRLDLEALHSSRTLPATPFMEAHYFQNNCFMKPDQLVTEAGRLAGIPGIVVQGRYDLLCPPATSQALAAAWREADIRVVEGAGHTLYDPGVRNAVMKAVADMASQITR